MKVPDIVDIKVAVKRNKISCYVKDNYIYMKNDIGECVRICEIVGATTKELPCHIGGNVYFLWIDFHAGGYYVAKKAVVEKICIGRFEDSRSGRMEMYKISVKEENGQEYELYGSDFGKGVFTTREAVEDALKAKRKELADERPEKEDKV